MDSLGFLFLGFALAWAVAFAYLWVLARRSANLQRQLDSIESQLRRHDQAPG